MAVRGGRRQAYAAACAVPACTSLFCGWLYLPHSPRLLYIQGDTAGASAALRYIAAGNRVPCPLDAGFELRPAPRGDVRTRSEPWSRMLSAPLRRTTLLLGGIWFALSFGWYGLMIWMPVSGRGPPQYPHPATRRRPRPS